jgi:hypothetical protein
MPERIVAAAPRLPRRDAAGRVLLRRALRLGCAIVFAGANAYPDGRASSSPSEIGDALASRFPVAAEVAASLYDDGADFIAEPFGTLKAASLICQAHASRPAACSFRPDRIGLSSARPTPCLPSASGAT